MRRTRLTAQQKELVRNELEELEKIKDEELYEINQIIDDELSAIKCRCPILKQYRIQELYKVKKEMTDYVEHRYQQDVHELVECCR